MINVRAETALKGGLFNALLDRHRVLIPASWFYEWKRTPGGKRGSR
jgi:putative SOS response-associated peptidase YedK